MSKLLKCLFVLVLLACAQRAAAQSLPNCPYYAVNSDRWYSCFKTLSEAEDFIRADPNGTHPTRQFLELTTNNPGSDKSDFGYGVRPQAGVEGAPGYRAGDNNGASTAYVQVACEITGTTALMQGFGPVSNCSNQPTLCTYGYYCSSKAAITQAISLGVKRPNCAPGSAWESVAPPAYPMGAGGGPPDGKPIYPPNTGSFYYHSSYYGTWLGGFFDFQYQYGDNCTGLGGGRLIEYMATPVTCPTGFSFSPGDPIDITRACRSNEWGEILALRNPDCGGCLPDNDDDTEGDDDMYGNPVVASTGQKIQRPLGWNVESMLGIDLVYNSNTTDTMFGFFGGGWNSLLQVHFLGNDYYGQNYSYTRSDGNLITFKTTTNQVQRSVGSVGSFMRGYSTNGCEHVIYESNRRVVVACDNARDHHVLRVEYPDAPQMNLTFNWVNVGEISALPMGSTFGGTIKSVTRGDGRKLDLHYDRIHVSSNCATSVAPWSCNALRLVGTSDDDGNLTVFDYNDEGRLSMIVYPDGNRERFEYGAAADICPASMPNACDGAANARMVRSLLTGVYTDALQPNGSYVSTRRGTYQYDNRGRAIVTTHEGDAGRREFSYDASEIPTIKRYTDATHFNTRRIAHARVQIYNKPALIVDTDSSGVQIRSKSNSYDAQGYAGSSTDFRGVRTDRTYNDAGLVTQVVDAANDASVRRTTQYDWDTNLRLLTQVRRYDSTTAVPGVLVSVSKAAYNSRGQRTASCTVDAGNAIAMAYACGSAANAPTGVRQWRTTYCEASDVSAGTCPLLGQPILVDGPRVDASDVTTLYYYASDGANCPGPSFACLYHKGDLRRVVNPLGQATEVLAYDGMGRALSVRDANNVVTDVEYSDRGWLTAIKVRGADSLSETDDAISRYSYDDVGNLLRVTSPDATFLAFDYDSSRRVYQVRDNAGNKFHRTLNRSGASTLDETLDANDAIKQTMSRVYDDVSRVKTLLDAYGKATSITLDGAGNLDVVNDPLDHKFDTDVDSLDRITRMVENSTGTGNEKAVTQYRYDARDNLTAVVDPKNLTTSYTYDGLGDLRQLSSPDTGLTSYNYNAAGLRASKTDARNIITGFNYDAAGRLISRTVPTAAQNIYLDYDVPQSDCIVGETFGVGRISRIRDESGSTRYCYDRLGRVVRKAQTVTGGSTLTTGMSYDAGGKLVAMTYPSGALVTYHHDVNGRIDRVDAVPTLGGTQALIASGITYLPFGPVNSISFGNGARTQRRAFDSNYRIDAINDNAASNPFFQDFTLNDVGNVSKVTERTGASTTITKDFSYDGLDRLTTHKSGASILESFTYDSTGNRLSKTAGSTTAYVYPATSHRLSSVGSTPRTYDNVGNTSTIGTTAKGSGFTYDDHGRMRDFKLAKKAKASFRFNGKGERVLKTNLSTATLSRQFVYDEAGHLLGEYTTAGARVKEYVWLGDTLVAILGTFPGKAYRFVETDHLGTPRAVVNPDSGVIEWRWDLNQTAFGDHAPNSNPDGDANQFDLSLRYPGQYADAESSTTYNYHRNYDQTSGRYLESDPIGLAGGASTYAYASGNALAYIDPLGLVDVNYLPPNDPNHDLADQYNPAGLCTVTGHGNPINMVDASWAKLTPEDVAAEIRAHCGSKKHVKLISCNTGLPGWNGDPSFAQRLADALQDGYTVDAPDNFTWWFPNGPKVAGTNEGVTWQNYGHPGFEHPTYNPNQPGHFNPFTPTPPPGPTP